MEVDAMIKQMRSVYQVPAKLLHRTEHGILLMWLIMTRRCPDYLLWAEIHLEGI